MIRNGFTERRKRGRLPLRLAVSLLQGASGASIHAETLNISSEGFFCLAPRAFAPGESLDCVITLPSAEPAQHRSVGCRATVVRVEDAPDGAFGVAFRLDDYSVLAGAIH